jgi:hypothetical protein
MLELNSIALTLLSASEDVRVLEEAIALNCRNPATAIRLQMRQWRAWRHNLQLPSRPTSKDALSSLGRWSSNGSTLLSRWHTYPTDCLKASSQVPSQMGRALIRDSMAAARRSRPDGSCRGAEPSQVGGAADLQDGSAAHPESPTILRIAEVSA